MATAFFDRSFVVKDKQSIARIQQSLAKPRQIKVNKRDYKAENERGIQITSHIRLILGLVLVFMLSPAWSCELLNTDAVKSNLETAFKTADFTHLTKQLQSSPLELNIENEYDEAQPIKRLKFKNLADLSLWFTNEYQFTEHRLIPLAVVCSNQTCNYALPELTLHHAIYLRGFKLKQSTQCSRLMQISLYLA
jgi:hypothetical protein